MSKPEHLLVVVLTLGIFAEKPAEARTWTDASGQEQVEADFVAFQADKVWLHRSDDRVAVSKVPVVETINFSYEDDHRDCEAVGVDPTTKTIFFVTRERDPSCYVYALPWPPHVPNKAFVARKIATLEIPATTAMDISSDGRRAVVLTYGDAYEYVRGAEEDWSEGFSRPLRKIITPVRIQGESICYGADDKTLYLTSEKRPTPLLEIPVIDSP